MTERVKASQAAATAAAATVCVSVCVNALVRDGTQGQPAANDTRWLAAAGSGCHSLKTWCTVYIHTQYTYMDVAVCVLSGWVRSARCLDASNS